MAKKMIPADLNKAINIFTKAAMGLMIGWGLLLVACQLIPFGVDEWRLIYNIKFKTAGELMGPLDLVQQFPRVYLSIFKAFTSAFDYTYWSLRFPSLFMAVAIILLAYKLMNELFTNNNVNRYLFVLIIIASPTFIHFFVQAKQYTMDIFLAMLALWQLLRLLNIATGVRMNLSGYLLLCGSFLIAPFFSYTYPIVVAPLFLIVFVHGILLWRRGLLNGTALFRLWLPLLIAMAAIISFYILDASQLMKDDKMHFYWACLMMHDGFNPLQFCRSLYNLFALSGSGLLFEIIYGALAILGLVTMLIKSIRSFTGHWNKEQYLALYCASLTGLVMLLYTAGKLPIGVARLNSFMLPATAIIIISFVNSVSAWGHGRTIAIGISALLFIGVAGSLATGPVNELLSDKHKRTMAIYINTQQAITMAVSKRIPIFITSGLAYPYEKMITYPCTNIPATELCMPPGYIPLSCSSFTDNIPTDWILKTYPAYKVSEHIPVYAINDLSELPNCMAQLPVDVRSVMAGDGVTFHEVRR
jgi:hypothetical protein